MCPPCFRYQVSLLGFVFMLTCSSVSTEEVTDSPSKTKGKPGITVESRDSNPKDGNHFLDRLYLGSRKLVEGLSPKANRLWNGITASTSTTVTTDVGVLSVGSLVDESSPRKGSKDSPRGEPEALGTVFSPEGRRSRRLMKQRKVE